MKPARGQRNRLRGTGFATAVALSLFLAGCSDTSGTNRSDPPPTSGIAVNPTAAPLPASSPSSSGPSAASTTVPTSVGDAALSAYKQMMAAMIQAATVPDPDFPLLAKYATGEALVSLRYSLSTDRRNGLVTKGPMRMAPQVVSVSSDGTTVKIADCLDDSQWLKYKADGSRKDDVPGGRRRTAAEVARVDGEWKVSVLRVEGTGTC